LPLALQLQRSWIEQTTGFMNQLGKILAGTRLASFVLSVATLQQAVSSGLACHGLYLVALVSASAGGLDEMEVCQRTVDVTSEILANDGAFLFILGAQTLRFQWPHCAQTGSET
jgi:hypothetical protein